MGSAIRKVFWAINDVEVMQCMKTSKLFMPITKDSGVRRKGRNENTVLSIPRYNLDELHFRVILAALITENGPVNTVDFANRLALMQADGVLQDRREAFMSTPLDPPETPNSGFIFAHSAMKAFKAMENSEWHRKNMV